MEEVKKSALSCRKIIFIAFALINLAIFLSLFVLFIYNAFIRKIIVTEHKETIENTKLDALSNINAEKENFVEPDVNLYPILYYEDSVNEINEFSEKLAIEVYEIKAGNIVLNSENLIKKPYTAIIYSKEKVADFTGLVLQISSDPNINSFRALEIDTSVSSNTEEFFRFVIDLKTKLKVLGVELILSIYPKWSSYIDYSYFKSIWINFDPEIDFLPYVPYVDAIKVKAFDYTSLKSILPGPITPFSFAKEVLQYMLYKGFPKEKLILGINTKSYFWTYRDFVEDFKQNHYTDANQAKVMNYTETINILSKIEPIETNSGDMAGYFITDKKYVLVYPTHESINKLVNLAENFAIKGISFRN